MGSPASGQGVWARLADESGCSLCSATESGGEGGVARLADLPQFPLSLFRPAPMTSKMLCVFFLLLFDIKKLVFFVFDSIKHLVL